MLSIRKFVGYTGAAAGISAAIALAISSQTGVAAAPAQVTPSQATPSAACTAAIQAIKSAVFTDASEDASERAVAKTNPDLAVDRTEDAAEFSNLKSLFGAARTACAPTASSPTTEQNEPMFTPSAQCTTAIQALKAIWAQGRRTTPAQLQQLQAALQGVRAACGWTPTTWGDRA